MKNLTQSLLGLFLLLVSSQLVAQNASDEPLKLLAQPNAQADTILLRWVVTNPTAWDDGVEAGYSLIRMTTHQNGVALSGADIQNSVVVLDSTLFPLTESDWGTQFPTDNNFAMVAKGALYMQDDSIALAPGATPTLADVVNSDASEEGRMVFALFAAEQDFEVAKGLALAYCDTDVQAGATYIYRLAINGTDIATAISISADAAPALPTIDTLLAEGMDSAVILEWDIAATEAYYSSYTVERSTDGSTFAPLSALPFIFGSEEEDSPTAAVYKDSIDSNAMTYYYRVRGRTPFGTMGPPSPVVTAQGVPPRISPFFLTVDAPTADENAVTLDWSHFDDSLTFRLQGFNIYRSESSTTPYVKMNSSLLAATDRTYTDAAPIPVAYYILEAIDDNNYSYQSPAKMVQLADSIPPAVPMGLTGSFVSPERVQLTWQANTESDLEGYRLFVANGATANFMQITTKPVANEQFVYEIDPEFIIDSIYFKILACDNRENYSDKSAHFALRRPDIVPPSSPVLQKVNATPTGIAIGWKFSSSEDVAYHRLERKPQNAPGWVDLLTISKADEAQYSENLDTTSIAATCYLDNTPLERRGYVYRLLAFDQDGNQASSELIPVRPFDNGQRGTIENFEAQAECLPIGTIDNQEGYDQLSKILASYQYGGSIHQDSLQKLAMYQVITTEEYNLLINKDPYEVKVFLDKRKIEVWKDNIIAQVNLMWGYGETEQLQDFQIYRSSENSPIMLYKTLPIEALTSNVFLDEDVRPNRRYYYQIVARHTDGGFSEKSKTLMVKVPKF